MKTKFYLFILLLLPLAAFAQSPEQEGKVPFNGQIVDLLGQPVKGVKVFVFDRNYSTLTDRKGRFGLTNVLPTDTVHLIYRRQQYDIPVAGNRSLRIVLGDQFNYKAESSVEMENLGYGWVSRRESVSSSSGISGETLRRTGKIHLLDALQGLVPGLYIQGSAMNGAKVNIRGINSINCPTEPLYIVDGVEVTSLDFVNIYDVESVEVMKDAYIYGSRGANGAILVTTKK